MSRLISVLVVLWLAIGLLATFQRNYFKGSARTCAHVSTILVTVVAGPLNYVGANPKVKNCDLPQPSK